MFFNLARLLLLWNLWLLVSWLHLINIDIASIFACNTRTEAGTLWLVNQEIGNVRVFFQSIF